jgi:uncharacterized protein
MGRSAQQSPKVDLDPLDTYLTSPESPANSMGLSDLDGFLTGLVAGPEMVKPSEWMPLVWGDEEPEFATPEEADAILGTIMARYNEILDCLDTDPDSFDPIFWEGEDGDVIVTDWAAGFMDAVILRSKAWAPLLQDDAGRDLMLPLLVLGSDDERPLFDAPPLPEDEIDELLADGPNVVIEAVLAAYQFWEERRAQ